MSTAGRRVMGQELDQISRSCSLAPAIGRCHSLVLFGAFQRKPNKRVICLVARFEKCNAEVIVVESGVMLLQLFGSCPVMCDCLFSLALLLSNLAAYKVIGKQYRRYPAVLND